MTRAIIDGLNIIKWYQPKREDTRFFEYKELPENYGAKLNSENKGYNLPNLTKMMQKYNDLHLIFSFRNPIDQCMSMIVRGQKTSEGGDGDDTLAPDGTVEGAIKAIKYIQHIHKEIVKLFSKRIYTVKMEGLIQYPEINVAFLAYFLGVKPTKKAFEFYQYNTNWRQKARYRDKLDRSQINIHKRWDAAYNGFFKDRKEDIDRIKEAFK